MTDKAKEFWVGVISLILAIMALAVAYGQCHAQDSAFLDPKYFFSTRAGEIDPDMIASPYNSITNDSTEAWLALKVHDAYLYGPTVLWQECPGADSVAVYVRVEDTLVVQFLVAEYQNEMHVERDLRGPLPWTRYIVSMKGSQLFGIVLPPQVRTVQCAIGYNELGARCYFGRVTAYYTSKADVAQPTQPTSTVPRYVDLLGRPCARGSIVKRLGESKFLVIQSEESK